MLRGFRLSVGLVVGLLLFVSVTAAPASVTTYLYDFNDLDAAFDPIYGGSGYLQGHDGTPQDNWSTWYYPYGQAQADYALRVAVNPMGGGPQPGDGLCVTMPGGDHPQFAGRVNDANWSFDLSNGEQFAFGCSMVTDYGLSAAFGHGNFFIANTVSGKSLGFGISVVNQGTSWFYGVSMYDASGTQILGGFPRPTARNQIWDFRMEVDTSAYGGEGAGSLFVKQRGINPDWQAVDGLQGLSLGLATAGADIGAANKLALQLKTRLVAFDDLWIEAGSFSLPPIPGDANLDDIVNLADFTILKAHFGQSPAEWTDGDFNDDNVVNLADFTIQKAHFGESRSTSSAVPEPATALLVFGAFAAVLRRRKRA